MRFLPALIVFGGAAAAYVYTHDDVARTLSPASWISQEGHAATAGSIDAELLANAPPEAIVAVAGPPELGLDDVFRFDLTPQTVTDRWNRVSTGLGDVRYQGY